MGKKRRALGLCSSSTWFTSPLVFFSLPIFVSACRKKMITLFFLHYTTGRQAKAQQTSQASKPRVPSEKEKNTSASAFQSGGFPPFPPRSNCLFSSLAGSLSLGKPIASSSREKMCFPKFELTPTSKQTSTVLVCSIPQIERHCCPGASKPVPADGDSS